MDNSPIQEIKNRLDIVEIVKEYVKLQKSGVNYRAPCPFHSEKTPSFFVSPSRQIWHCFGACSEGGDIFKFIMKTEGVEFNEALRILAAKAGIQLKKQDPKLKNERQKVYEICEWATRFFEKNLETVTGKKVEKYLLDRKITKESIKEWRLGYSLNKWDSLVNFLSNKGYSYQDIEKAGLILKKQEGNGYYDRFRDRIIFPIFDFSSQPIGFGGRIFESNKEAKYINTPNTIIYDKSKVLYGLNKARNDIRKQDTCVLVEGYTDVIMSHQIGINNVVATSGTALTPYQLDILKRYTNNIITAFDMDIAGDSATKRGIDMAQEKDFNIKVAVMPQGLDPADLIAKKPNQWQEIINKSLSIISFYFNNAFSIFDPEIPENKKEIAKIILPIIKSINSDIERDFWIQELAKKLKVKESAVLQDLQKIKDDLDYYTDDKKQEGLVKKKSRKDLLEERFLMILIKNKKNIEKIDLDEITFLSQESCQIIKTIKSNKETSLEIKEKINYLGLKSDIDMESIDTVKELDKCLSEMKILSIKEKLNEISQQMKEAQSQNQIQEVESLKKDFNLYCKKLLNL